MNLRGLELRIDEIVRSQNREEAYYQLVDLFMNASAEVRDRIRQCWDFGVIWNYPSCATLACSKKQTHSCEERIRAALAYYVIEDLRQEDIRDQLVALAMIYNSCHIVNIDPKRIFEEMALVSTPKVATFLREFIARRPEDKSLDAFMLTKRVNADGEIEIVC